MIEFDCPGNQQVRFNMHTVHQDGRPAPLEPNSYEVAVINGLGTFEYNPTTNGLVFRLEDNPVSDPLLFFPTTEYEVKVTLRLRGRAVPPV